MTCWHTTSRSITSTVPLVGATRLAALALVTAGLGCAKGHEPGSSSSGGRTTALTESPGAAGSLSNPQLAQPAPTSPAPAPSTSDGARQRLLARIQKAIATNKLTTLSLDQLSFEFDDSTPGVTFVDVREKHVGTGGGDPQTAPRLFSFEVRGANGPLMTDAKSLTGEVEPIGE
jgi:hypothetical protein